MRILFKIALAIAAVVWFAGIMFFPLYMAYKYSAAWLLCYAVYLLLILAAFGYGEDTGDEDL